MARLALFLDGSLLYPTPADTLLLVKILSVWITTSLNANQCAPFLKNLFFLARGLHIPHMICQISV